MAAIIYGLCALTALVCAVLLFTGYRRSKYRLLLWGALCFGGLTVSNTVLIFDKIVFTATDFATWRYLITLISLLVFLYGLIWDTE